MDTVSRINRFVTCTSCGRMIMARDPRVVGTTSGPGVVTGFWGGSTFHLVVCSLCEHIGVLQVVTGVEVYTDYPFASSTHVATTVVKASDAYMKACDITGSFANLGDFMDKVPIVNRDALEKSFPYKTWVNYVSMSDKSLPTLGMRPYMITNFL
ncbi:hypothetical protein HRG_001435 [Hirsutella rhossiliensis]|uniref:Uncharacterized protein n=1 Tax=Hirsutella rhossiliensis TaxID=111463 RepID=A0A9P8SMN8_9HYPO|nr:uncharacterized protein HRG_01435 [Hirsutella rhossiliensis]KAH0968793.1 hypothetical protein HRG_01435 [Hirsutella rhossiliensis]